MNVLYAIRWRELQRRVRRDGWRTAYVAASMSLLVPLCITGNRGLWPLTWGQA